MAKEIEIKAINRKMKDKEFVKYKKFCRENKLHFCNYKSLQLFYKTKKGVV